MKAILTFGLFMLALVSAQEEARPQEYVAQIRRHSSELQIF